MSLLESIAGIAIISIGTMIAVPQLIQTRENYELAAAAYQVAARLQYARIKTVARNRDCRFRVTSAVTYVIECETPSWMPVDFGSLARGITITSNATPRFHRRGNVSPAATISLWNPKGRSRRVIVNITGRIRIE